MSDAKLKRLVKKALTDKEKSFPKIDVVDKVMKKITMKGGDK